MFSKDEYAIIVAGGMGNRMGKSSPKQFLLLSGKPVLMYSVHAFHDYNPYIQVVVALHPDYFETWGKLCNEYDFQQSHRLVPGGETRYHSVKNALDAITGEGFVSVHDAARPLVSKALISSTFGEARKYSNAIPAIPVNETVRTIESGYPRLVDRNSLRIIQTPQVFEINMLKRAYQQKYQPSFTDDASLLEAQGVHLHLVEGDLRNIKITYPCDLDIAEAYLKSATDKE
jgi:2-C-methyl-D-erythritol 4-phosphate cytidylyltransferase